MAEVEGLEQLVDVEALFGEDEVSEAMGWEQESTYDIEIGELGVKDLEVGVVDVLEDDGGGLRLLGKGKGQPPFLRLSLRRSLLHYSNNHLVREPEAQLT